MPSPRGAGCLNFLGKPAQNIKSRPIIVLIASSTTISSPKRTPYPIAHQCHEEIHLPLNPLPSSASHRAASPPSAPPHRHAPVELPRCAPMALPRLAPATPPAATIQWCYSATSTCRNRCLAMAPMLPRLDPAPTPATLGGHRARRRGRAPMPMTSTGYLRPRMVTAKLQGAP